MGKGMFPGETAQHVSATADMTPLRSRRKGQSELRQCNRLCLENRRGDNALSVASPINLISATSTARG